MQLGMVGLGRMGANIVRRLMRGGHECVVFDVNPDSVKQLEGEGAIGGPTMEEFVAKLSKPRVVWVMIPAGITGRIVDKLGRCWGRATSSSTAATPTTATTCAGPPSCASRASTTSTSAPAAACSASSAATA